MRFIETLTSVPEGDLPVTNCCAHEDGAISTVIATAKPRTAFTNFLFIKADPSAAVCLKLSIVLYIFMMLATHNDNLVNKVKGRGRLNLTKHLLQTLFTNAFSVTLMK